MRVCLYVLCGHLLGKGCTLCSRLWCLLSFCHFPIGILGQVWYLIVSIPDLCTLTYSEHFLNLTDLSPSGPARRFAEPDLGLNCLYDQFQTFSF